MTRDWLKVVSLDKLKNLEECLNVQELTTEFITSLSDLLFQLKLKPWILLSQLEPGEERAESLRERFSGKLTSFFVQAIVGHIQTYEKIELPLRLNNQLLLNNNSFFKPSLLFST